MLANNKIEVLEEFQVVQVTNPPALEEVQKDIAYGNLYKVLIGKSNMQNLVADAYKKLPDESNQLFQPAVISSEFMEYFGRLEERKALLTKQIENLQALPPKQFLKQQQNELAEKKKELKEITDQLKVVFKQK